MQGWQVAERERGRNVGPCLATRNSPWPSPSANHFFHSSSASSAVTGPEAERPVTSAVRKRYPAFEVDNQSTPSHQPSNGATRSLLLMSLHKKSSLPCSWCSLRLRTLCRGTIRNPACPTRLFRAYSVTPAPLAFYGLLNRLLLIESVDIDLIALPLPPRHTDAVYGGAEHAPWCPYLGFLSASFTNLADFIFSHGFSQLFDAFR